MENDIVLERISNLKGRLGYEEKKAKKLGFASLYDYMEEKINSENNALNPVIEGAAQPSCQKRLLKGFNILSHRRSLCSSVHT